MPPAVIVFPNCKINLGLHITGKRPDGYHDLQTVFYPLPLHDALEVVTGTGNPTMALTTSGIPLDGAADNICTKAYRLLQQDFPQLPAVAVHLHKYIPVGAGLGGGSADGAFLLQALNRKYSLGLDEPALMAYALQMGSDCPFFIHNRPCLATGRGEHLQPLSLQLSDYRIVLVNPGIHIATAWAFARIRPAAPEAPLESIVRLPVPEWKHRLKNDFEAPVFSAYPDIAECKEALYRQGALYAALSGTGATVYGLFEKNAHLSFSFPPHYFVKEC